MHKLIAAALLLCCTVASAQLSGRITTTGGEAVPYVSINVAGTYNNTSSNEQGQYTLHLQPGSYTLRFQSIGFKPKNQTVTVKSEPQVVNIELQPESYQLDEVVVKQAEDPAYAIMRQAIAHREENAKKTGKYEADFYSKGIFRVKNMPKRMMGVKIDVNGADLDSTGSGVLSLSETVSHITVQYPGKLSEKVIASKTSGNSGEYSFNSASEAQFSFYDNYMDFDFDIDMISPLAKNAMGYYRYKYLGGFTDEYGNSISKIKVIPRRDKEPVFEGEIYIVDDSWAIYAADLTIKGYRLRVPAMESLQLKQNFTYNPETKLWALNLQTFDISAGMLGIKVSGRYTHAYSNYVFYTDMPQDALTYNRVDFAEDARKKDSLYWAANRPVPLTQEERADYAQKEAKAAGLAAKPKDSVITNANRFKVLDVLSGYDYKSKKFHFNYEGVLDLPGYNTVQGWNFSTGLTIGFTNPEKKRGYSGTAHFNYGIAEDRLRVWGELPLTVSKQTFYFSGGNRAAQFNPQEPIDPVINMISTLIFKDNYMKLYDKTFAAVHYSRNVFKKLKLTGRAEYLRRRPLFNNTDYVLIKNKDSFTSNDPLNPGDETSAPFVKHTLYKANIGGGIQFGKNFYYRPASEWAAATEGDVPGIWFMYEKAFASNVKAYEYDFVSLRALYQKNFRNKGDFGVSIKAGKFFNADSISFTDYKHFNGNRTHVSPEGNYLNSFNLLPYYTHSTNDSFVETHLQHNFKGFIMNKIPLLDLLQYNLVLGYHGLHTPQHKPYQEFTVGFDNFGFGNFRFFRIDYVRAYNGNGFAGDGFMIGIREGF